MKVKVISILEDNYMSLIIDNEQSKEALAVDPAVPHRKVFCGHKYTIKNLKFALLVEPDNQKVKEMLSWARARDDEDKPTVPSTLVEEFEYNPFLRLSEEGVQRFTGKTDPVEVLRVLRKEKDKFKKPKERVPPPHVMLALEWGLLRP